jgi:hypothetical protein
MSRTIMRLADFSIDSTDSSKRRPSTYSMITASCASLVLKEAISVVAARRPEIA